MVESEDWHKMNEKRIMPNNTILILAPVYSDIYRSYMWLSSTFHRPFSEGNHFEISHLLRGFLHNLLCLNLYNNCCCNVTLFTCACIIVYFSSLSLSCPLKDYVAEVIVCSAAYSFSIGVILHWSTIPVSSLLHWGMICIDVCMKHGCHSIYDVRIFILGKV